MGSKENELELTKRSKIRENDKNDSLNRLDEG
jgi:hypothetical protein